MNTLTSNAKDWRCFYCDEVFTTEVDARNHFGSLEGSETTCRIKAPGEFALLQALRNAEEALARYRAEDSDALRAMWSMTADHQTALRREEEKGYARALRDTNYQEHTQKAALATDEIRDLACCDTFVRESASEFCATCGYTNLDHLRKRHSLKAVPVDPNPLDPEYHCFRKCLKGHARYAISFPECPSCKIERERNSQGKPEQQ